MIINCGTEWAAAAAHHPVRTANVTLRDSVRTQLAVFSRPDVVSTRLIQRTHTFEPAEIAVFAALLRPETVVLDIGANIGWWTFNFATTHAVHAFEPNPSNLALQALSRCLNPRLAQRITVYPVGLYNREPARCELQSHPLNLGNTHTLCGTPKEILEAKRKMRKTLVPRGSSAEMRTLDTLVPEWLFRADKIVKLDVEGSEQVALMGGTRLLTEGVPPRALFMEITFYKGTKRRELYQFLERHGYVPARMVQYNLLFVHARDPRSAPRRDWVSSAAVCDNYCAFRRPPECNATCGLKGLQNCCDWWGAA